MRSMFSFSSVTSLFTGVCLMLPINGGASSNASYGSSRSSNNASHENQSNQDLPSDVKDFLLDLARQSLEACVKGKPMPKPENPPEITKKDRGCFVTLTKAGVLRGCIGYIEGIKPLFEAVIDNAKNAALSDRAFPKSPLMNFMKSALKFRCLHLRTP